MTILERYDEIKRENPGSILLFRVGDFYELFHDDAKVGARVLRLTLTTRDKRSENPILMAGFPHHSLDGYLHKLIKAGHRVAICEQVDDPQKANGLPIRKTKRIVTPAK